MAGTELGIDIIGACVDAIQAAVYDADHGNEDVSMALGDCYNSYFWIHTRNPNKQYQDIYFAHGEMGYRRLLKLGYGPRYDVEV